MIVASNESIFEAMARRTVGSDAGMVRNFEIEMTETPATDKTSAEVTLLFETLSQNYGHAGRVYAQYLATHVDEVDKLVKDTYLKIAGEMESAERFWYGMIAILLVGATLAKRLGLVEIDTKKLHGFLMSNLDRLRGRTNVMSEEHTLPEIVAEYLRERGNAMLIIDKFYRGVGRPDAKYLPEIKEAPKSGKCQIVIGIEDKTIRFATRDFVNWLTQRELPAYGVLDRLETELGGKRVRCVLGLATSYAGPRIWAVELDATQAGFSSLDESLDSSSETSPED